MMNKQIISIVLAGLTLAGCLERLELVRIAEDGAVSVEHRIKGDGADLRGGATAMPDERGYQVERFTRPRTDGKGTEHHLVARASYPSVERMPGSYARAGDPHATRDLQFRNRLVIRREGRRTFYVFTRVYQPRSWARYEHRRRRAFPEEIEKLARKDWGKKPWPERRKVIAALLGYERGKSVEFSDQALEGLPARPGIRAEALLAAREALLRHFSEQLAPERVARLLGLPERELAAEAGRLMRGVEAGATEAAARALGLDAAGRARLLQGYRAARHDFEVTDDLGDESFWVRVTLPGKLLRHDGDASEGSTAIWKFDGKQLRDRPHRLTAVSYIER